MVVTRSEKLWNLPTKETRIDCILFCRKILEFANGGNSNSMYFVLPRSEKFRNLPANNSTGQS
jgi:hypothetical protein